MEKVFNMAFGKIFPLYVAKATKKDKTYEQVIEIMTWLTGYTQKQIESMAQSGITMKEFFDNAPCLNPKRSEIKGVICGVRVESIDDPLMQNIRYLDKLIDELAKGKSMDKILRQ